MKRPHNTLIDLAGFVFCLALFAAIVFGGPGCGGTARTSIKPAEAAVKHGETASAPVETYERTVQIQIPGAKP